MKKTHIIGLSGFAGVGKDTVADLLVTHCGFRKVAFSDSLYAEVSVGFAIDTIDLSHPSAKNQPMAGLSMRRAPRDFLAAVALSVPHLPRSADGMLTPEWLDEPRSPRQVLQWWGTEYRRKQRDTYWTRLLLQRMADMTRNGANRVVVTDCRFANEADTVHALGGRIWQVTRPGIHAATTPEGVHVSANGGETFKPAAVISNCHDMRHLQQLVLSEFVALDSGIVGATVAVPA